MTPGDETSGAVEALVEFSRVLARAASPEEIHPILARSAVDQLGCDAAAVIDVREGEPRLAAAAACAAPSVGWTADVDLGPELTSAFLEAAGGRYRRADSLPLVAGGNLFGTLLLVFTEERGLAPDRMLLAEGLVSLAASGLSSAAQYEALSGSYADLRASRDALARGEKLRALGQMAAGVSHDLKNILNPLSLPAIPPSRTPEELERCAAVDRRDAWGASTWAREHRSPAQLQPTGAFRPCG